MTALRFWRAGENGPAAVRTDVWWLAGLTLLLIATGLGLRDPWPADEPRFVLVAQDMLRTGNWLLPHIGGDLYPDKPPLYFWLLAATLGLTGSVRAFLLPSLCATLGSVLLVYDLGRRLWTRETGLAAALVLLLTIQFVWQGRQAQIDATLCFFTTLGLYGLLRHLLAGPAWGWYWAGWAAAGLGVITKGVGFLPLLVLVPYTLLHFDRRRIWQPRPLAGTGVLRPEVLRWALGPAALLAAIGAWLVPMLLAAMADPAVARYRDEILLQQTMDRYANAWHHTEPLWYFIVNVIPGLWLPLTALLPWLVPRWRAALQAHDTRILLLLGWIGLVLLFFSSSTGKRGVYVLPAVPALALAAGPWVRELIERRGPQRMLYALASALPGIALCTGLYLWLIAPGLRAAVLAEHGIEPLGPLLAIAVVGIATCLVTGRRRALGAYAATLAAVLAVVGYWINPAINATRSGAAFARQLEALTADVPELGLVAYKEQYLLALDRPTINFGHARWRVWEQEADDAAAWLQEGPARRALLIDAAVRARCFARAHVLAADRANRKDWFLVRDGAEPACVARGRPEAALTYSPH